jgi:DNA-binding MarR family transcriptional regulator
MSAQTKRLRSAPDSPGVEPGELLEWVERVASFFSEHYGLSPITGRILGWLMVCDPPEQSGEQIAEAIAASRASITTNIRLLTAGDLVRRRTRLGERTAYYVIEDDAWEKVVKRRIDSLASFRQITKDGIELLAARGRRAGRVRAAHDVFEWYAELLANAGPMPPTTDGRQ